MFKTTCISCVQIAIYQRHVPRNTVHCSYSMGEMQFRSTASHHEPPFYGTDTQEDASRIIRTLTCSCLELTIIFPNAFLTSYSESYKIRSKKSSGSRVLYKVNIPIRNQFEISTFPKPILDSRKRQKKHVIIELVNVHQRCDILQR